MEDWEARADVQRLNDVFGTPRASEATTKAGEFFTVKDSGNRIEFETGSRRDTNDGKPRYDLIGRHMLKRLAHHLAKGAKKYGENNWALGQPVSRSYESALRHLMQWRDGDVDEDHLSAVIFNIMSIIHVQEEVKLDKLPDSLLKLD